MKKLLTTLLLILTFTIGFSQVTNHKNPVKLSGITEGTEIDSILVMESDEKMKWIKTSDFIAKMLADVNDFPLDSVTFNDGESVTWNTDFKTLNIPTGFGPVLQAGQEFYFLVYNDTGSQIDNGKIIKPVSAFTVGSENIPTVILAQADTFETCEGTLFMATNNIADDGLGMGTLIGRVSDVPTSSFGLGDDLYLSGTSPGDITNIKPEFPYYELSIGGVLKVHATEGVVGVNFTNRVEDTFDNFHNGTFRESFDFLITSDGATITGTLTPTDGHPDMTMIFSSGWQTLDTSPGATVVLTAGTDTDDQINYVYIPESTKVLTVSTSGFPLTTEYISVAIVGVESATRVQTYGEILNQNHNDHVQSTTSNQGHLSHMARRIRIENARWDSGVTGSSTIDTGSSPDDVWVQNTSGWVYQLHLKPYPVHDTEVSDFMRIVNNFTTPYDITANLNTEIADALGVSLTNKSFSFVLWGIQNKEGEVAPLMINLPIGSYAFNFPDDAVADLLGYSVYAIPKDYVSTGFLIARFTYTLSNDGLEWVLYSTESLVGKTPNTIAGGAGAGGGGDVTFTAHTDTPSSYSSQGGKIVAVAGAENALEFVGNVVFTDGTQTITGAKTFDDGAFKLRNVADTFDGLFTNTNTADRTYTFQDASGILAFTSDIFSSPLTTKGDLFTFSTVDARLAVGTNGQRITADSGESTGLKWIDFSVAGDDLESDLKGEFAISSTDIDWDLGVQGTKTLSGNITFTFSNYTTTKYLNLELTGDYTITWPSGIEGDLSGYDGTLINIIQLYCVDQTTPKFIATLEFQY